MSAARVAGPAADQQRVDVGVLLQQVGQHDRLAFDDLYELTGARVYGLARKILVDADLSAETTQDVFFALWEGTASRFDSARGCGMSWIMTLTHRRAVDKVRAEETRRARDMRWGIKNREVDYDQVADTVVQQTEVDAVRACLHTLSVIQRQAIDLAYYAGLTYVEVARELDIPVPTAKTRIRDGLKRLKLGLQDPA